MVLLVLIGTICLFAAVTAWRGRRSGNEPRCAACEFDLTGLFPLADCCPECGAGLAPSGAVATGARRRNRRLLTAGLTGLVVCVSLGVLASRGILTTQRLVGYFPTDRLIAWSVESPDGLLEDACWGELYQRVAAGSLSRESQQGLFDALVTALERTDWRWRANQSSLLRALAASQVTDNAVIDEIAAYLTTRALDKDSFWTSDWSFVLEAFRESGVVSDADWEALVKAECTPRVRVYPGGRVRPGQELTLDINFEQRVHAPNGSCVIEVLLPEGARFLGWYERLGHRFRTGRTGLPGSGGSERLTIRAPEAEGLHKATVRVWFTESVPDLSDMVHDSAPPAAKYLMAEETIRLEVSPEAAGADNDLASWVSERLLPAKWNGTSSGGGDRASYGATVEIAGTEGGFTAAGFIEAFVDGKDRRRMGRFLVSNSENSNSSSWMDASGEGSSSRGGTGGGPSRAAIDFEVDARFAFLRDRVRYFIVFDKLSLPDGRQLDEGETMELELWTDPLRAGPTGW